MPEDFALALAAIKLYCIIEACDGSSSFLELPFGEMPNLMFSLCYWKPKLLIWGPRARF